MRRRFALTDSTLGYLLVIPMLLWTIGIVIYPLLSTIRLSFFDQRVVVGEGAYVGLALYRKMLLSREVWDAFVKDLAWTFGSFAVNNTVAMLVALLLWEKFRGANLLRTLVVIPWIVPGVITAIMWRWMLGPTLGVVNQILVRVGLLTKPLLFLASAQQAIPTIVGVNVWTHFGFRALIILAALFGIPEELFDAAKVDGANAFQRFRHITLPGVLPVLAIVALLGAFMTFNNVSTIWLLTAGGPGTATTTLPILIYQKAYLTWRVSEAAVLSVMMAVLLGVVAAIYFKFSPETT